MTQRRAMNSVAEGGLGIFDHLRLEVERRREVADAEGLDLGTGPNSAQLAREARARAIELHLCGLLDGPRTASAAEALGSWLADEVVDVEALDRLRARLDAIDREHR